MKFLKIKNDLLTEREYTDKGKEKTQTRRRTEPGD